MSSSIFKWYTDIPDDAKEVAKVTQRVFTDELQEVIAHGIYPDLDGYWDDEDDCWYLWSIPDTEPNWKTHYDYCLRKLMRFLPIPYKFLKITSKEGSHGYTYKSAECLVHETGRETTFNDKLFDGIPEGSNFIFDREKGTKVVVISEEEIPECLEQVAEGRRQREEEAARIHAEKEATGRFRWWKFEDTYKPGTFWECEAETVADELEDFWEAAADVMTRHRGPSRPKLTPDDIKDYGVPHSPIKEFFNMAQEGDTLEYVVAYRDPLAASGDMQIRRDGETVAYYNIWVS